MPKAIRVQVHLLLQLFDLTARAHHLAVRLSVSLLLLFLIAVLGLKELCLSLEVLHQGLNVGVRSTLESCFVVSRNPELVGYRVAALDLILEGLETNKLICHGLLCLFGDGHLVGSGRGTTAQDVL
jgi:hypothetical protein